MKHRRALRHVFYVALWCISSLVAALVMLYVLHRPSLNVIAQWAQPAELTYDDRGPYYVSVVERGTDWSGSPLYMEASHFIYAGREPGHPSYGHMINFSFYPSYEDDLPTFLQKTNIQWTAEGVQMEFQSGHRLFIPKDSFIGGR